MLGREQSGLVVEVSRIAAPRAPTERASRAAILGTSTTKPLCSAKSVGNYRVSTRKFAALSGNRRVLPTVGLERSRNWASVHTQASSGNNRNATHCPGPTECSMPDRGRIRDRLVRPYCEGCHGALSVHRSRGRFQRWSDSGRTDASLRRHRIRGTLR